MVSIYDGVLPFDVFSQESSFPHSNLRVKLVEKNVSAF